MFEHGQLWALEIDQIDTSSIENPSILDYISEGFQYLGYFFVTEESIYTRFHRSGLPAEDINQLISSLHENFEETFKERDY